MIHALTIDVEEYFHVHAFGNVIKPTNWDEYPSRVVDSTRFILELLAARGVRATFFVLGCVARRHPQLVREIYAAEHEVASHGFAHQRVDSLTSDQFRIDVRMAKQVLEDVIGAAVVAYRAPSFSITANTPWALPILVDEGHSVDSSHAAGRGIRSTEGISSSGPFLIETTAGPITEFPLPSARLCGTRIPVGGGGYLRLLPYWWTRQQLRRIALSQRPFCIYVHPWEFDSGQPRLSAPWLQNLRHRINMSTMTRKLEQVLADFEFTSVSSALASQAARKVAVAA